MAMFWSKFLVTTAKQDQSGSFFFCLIYCVNDFFYLFLMKIEVTAQIGWE